MSFEYGRFEMRPEYGYVCLVPDPKKPVSHKLPEYQELRLTGMSKSAKDGKSGPTDDQTEMLRRRTHDRVDELFDEAKRGKFYGNIGLEVAWENGHAKCVRRRLEGTDK